MEPRLSFVTPGVADLTRAAKFYEEVLRLPRVKDSPEVVFFEPGKTWLAIIPKPQAASWLERVGDRS